MIENVWRVAICIDLGPYDLGSPVLLNTWTDNLPGQIDDLHYHTFSDHRRLVKYIPRNEFKYRCSL